MITICARIVATATVVLAATACGENTSGIATPDRASYGGGYTYGGGNRSDTSATGAMQHKTPSVSDKTGGARGSGGFGSGH